MPKASLAQKKDFVAKALCPRLLVCSSSALDNLLHVNNFDTFAELLAPFGQDVSAQITVQDGQGAPYFLDKINVKFTTDFSIQKPQAVGGPEVDEMVISSVLDNIDKQMPEFLTETGIDMEVVKSEEPIGWAPWYTLFRQQWVNDMQASEHESFVHPVACLLVASSTDSDPVWTLKELQNSAEVMRVRENSFSGSSVMFYYMLVHDERDTGAMATVDYKFDLLRKALGQNCALLRLNSNTNLIGDDSEQSKVSNVWRGNLAATYPTSPLPDKQYGQMMTMRDVAALKDCVKQVMVRSVVPHMQYMIRLLSDQTANQRRGITGRLFSAGRRYFGTTTRNINTFLGVDGDVCFKYDSPEAMMRKLADYSFMLKDFRFAQSVYQVARRDFQSEKAWKCYAGAQEMVGLCKLMWEVQAARSEFDTNFDDAISMYMHKTHQPQVYLAMRCVIMYYEMLKHHKMYAYAPQALARAPASLPSLYAVMNEQAAYAFMKMTPQPETRKFSFYAMVAGQAYQKAGMGELAHRCFRMVRLTLSARRPLPRHDDDDEEEPSEQPAKYSSLARSNWAAIDAFVNHELGRQSVAAQSYDEAFQYFLALMGNDRVPPPLQSKYLQELLQLFLESGDQSTAHDNIELPLPVIDPRMARIIMSPELEGEDGVWEWRFDGTMPQIVDDGRRCCSVGESVAVLLMVSNPLTIGVTLNNFTLDCRFSGDDSGDGSTAAFDVSTVGSVALEGGQMAMVTVNIVVHRPGKLTIEGAKYLLCDILPSFKSLKLPGRRLNDTKEQRSSIAYAPDTALEFTIDPHLPCLKISLEDLPDTLMSGSMHLSKVRIENTGDQACQGILLWQSHPSFFDIRSPMLDSDGVSVPDMYPTKEISEPVEHKTVSNTLRDSSTLALVGANSGLDGFFLPLTSLDPGHSFTVPIWVRGDRVGAHTLTLFIGASNDLIPEPPVTLVRKRANDSHTLRSRRYDLDLVVTPSLRINAFVRASARVPSERLLGVEIENLQSDVAMHISQTTCVSGHYQLEPLAESTETAIGPQQTLSLMYRARPVRDASEHRPESFALGALQQFIYSAEKPEKEPVPIALTYSTDKMGDTQIDCIESPLHSYMQRTRAHWRRTMLRSEFPLIGARYLPAIFPLYGSFSIDFALFWHTPDKSHRGHHSVTGIDLGMPQDYLKEALEPPAQGVARTLLAESMQERSALVQSIAARPMRRSERPLDVGFTVGEIQQTGDLRTAKVQIRIHNHSWRFQYRLSLELISPIDLDEYVSADVRLDYTGSRSAWAWVGTTQFDRTIDKHGEIQIDAEVACSMPGAIDIAIWQLEAEAVDAAADTQFASQDTRCVVQPTQPFFVLV
ncbi:hypothetical protein EC988_001237 [Linderina pennispora]|nr:hypothetical protein EC988_001237 [Linderina pennispora]